MDGTKHSAAQDCCLAVHMITVAVAIRGRRPCKGVEGKRTISSCVNGPMQEGVRRCAVSGLAKYVPKCQRSAPFVQVTMVLAAVLRSAPNHDQ